MNAPSLPAGRTALRTASQLFALGLVVVSVSACGTMTRLSEVGGPPSLDGIKDPHANPDYKPVSLPMPSAQPVERNPNSLWRNGARAFFKDQRAKQVGDILTVTININDKANVANATNQNRAAQENAKLPKFLGFENPAAGANRGLKAILPDGVDLNSLIDGGSTTANAFQGDIVRAEAVTLTLAALIIQVLPNGNLVVKGKQEVRVNHELRELTLTGVIRPEDITSTNTIPYERIAEARISYGGRGVVSDLQQPRYGQQIYDILFPF